MSPTIVTDGLTKRYGDTVAVDSLDLVIERGEVYGLLGPNGAGKTTTILMLLGLSEPTGGRVSVLGFDPAREPLEVKQRVGYLPDSVGFYESLTGRENLDYAARLNRLAPRVAVERIESVLAEVGLSERADDPVGAYSRGMRQRLGVAGAMVKNPDVLILDEPTVSIDPEGVADMLALIRRLPDQQGVTVLLSSHLLQQVEAVCDRVGIFVAGRLVAQGSTQELGARHGGRVVHELRVLDGDPTEVLAGIDGVIEVRSDGDLSLVGADRDLTEPIALALAACGLVPVHLCRRSEGLGEIYRRYFTERTGRDDHD